MSLALPIVSGGTPLLPSATLDASQLGATIVVYVMTGRTSTASGRAASVAYVGCTTDAEHRFRQHAGEIEGGAKRLKRARDVRPAFVLDTGQTYAKTDEKNETEHAKRCQILKLESAIKRAVRSARGKRFREDMDAPALNGLSALLRAHLLAIKLVLMRTRWSSVARPSAEQAPVRLLVAEDVMIDLEELDAWLRAVPEGWTAWRPGPRRVRVRVRVRDEDGVQARRRARNETKAQN
jgi:hypothetical protein